MLDLRVASRSETHDFDCCENSRVILVFKSAHVLVRYSFSTVCLSTKLTTNHYLLSLNISYLYYDRV